jgi:hypothetical protein
VSKPTSTFGSFCRANFPSTASSAAGLSLLAQPAAFTCSVSRIVLSSAITDILNYGEGRKLLTTDEHRFYGSKSLLKISSENP